MRRLIWTLGGLGLGLVAWAAHGQTTSSATRRLETTSPSAAKSPAARHLSEIEARWQDSLAAFAEADRVRAPAPGGVLFVGSSSIRLWTDLETQFDVTPAVIKRGFGGSRLADCARYVDRLVLPYKPRLVVVYAGDNDLAEGATPQQVLERFRSFVETVRAELPETRIAYVSIKPSPLRATLMPQIDEANGLIEAYATTVPQLDFIDVHDKMLDADGQPRAELFQADRLHLNAAGYALWRKEIAVRLKLALPPMPLAAEPKVVPVSGPGAALLGPATGGTPIGTLQEASVQPAGLARTGAGGPPAAGTPGLDTAPPTR